MNDPLVNMTHARKAGMCVRGVREWCRRHDLDFRRVCRDGYPASLIETTDAMGAKVAALAREEQQ